jgi:hypothetical protein
MVFAGSPDLWRDWGRILNWILIKSENHGRTERNMLRQTLRTLRKTLGKKPKVKRDTTVLSDAELLKLLDSATKRI